MGWWETLKKIVAPIVEKVIKPIVKAIQTIVSNAQSSQQHGGGSGGSSHDDDDESDDAGRRGRGSGNKFQDLLLPQQAPTDLGQISQGLATGNFLDADWSVSTESAGGAGSLQQPVIDLELPNLDAELLPFGGNILIGGAGFGRLFPTIGPSNLTPQQMNAIQNVDPSNLESWSLGVIAAATSSEAEFYRYTSPYAFWQWSDVDDNPPIIGVWGVVGFMTDDLPEIDSPWPDLDDEGGIWTLPPDVYPDPDDLPEIDSPWPDLDDEGGIWTLPPDEYPDPDDLPDIDQPWGDMPEEERGPGSNILAAEEEEGDAKNRPTEEEEKRRSQEIEAKLEEARKRADQLESEGEEEAAADEYSTNVALIDSEEDDKAELDIVLVNQGLIIENKRGIIPDPPLHPKAGTVHDFATDLWEQADNAIGVITDQAAVETRHQTRPHDIVVPDARDIDPIREYHIRLAGDTQALRDELYRTVVEPLNKKYGGAGWRITVEFGNEEAGKG